MEIECLSIYMDGDCYCVAEGEYPSCADPHENIHGYGATKIEAFEDFLRQYKHQRIEGGE